jgi:carboxymethylenebutenolidase
MGANYAWWLPKKRPDIGAVVMFYSPGDTGDIAASNAPVQLHWSPDDAYEDPPYIESFSQAMRGSGRGYEDYSYPGRAHWFFEPDRPEYHREDAEKGWDRIVAFFRRELEPGASR